MPKLVIKDRIDKVEIHNDERSIRLYNENIEFFESIKKGILWQITDDAIGKKVSVTIEW